MKDAALLMLLVACGCGSPDVLPLAPVYGVVTYRGKPLDHGEVVFNPETRGVQSAGAIAQNGSYTMRTGGRQGTPLGKFVVTVYCRQKPGAQQVRDMRSLPESLIPSTYSDDARSPLRFEVRTGNNEFPIELE